jgi:predicted transcriptional regulator
VPSATEAFLADIEEAKRLYEDERLSARKIAALYEVSDPTVAKHLKLDAGVVLRPAGRGNLTAEQKTHVAHRSVELFDEGVRPNEIVRILASEGIDVSRRVVDAQIKAAGRRPHSPGNPRKSPVPAERPCEHCGKPLKPTRGADAGRRFCDKACENASKFRRAEREEVGRRVTLERHARARAELEQHKKQSGLLETVEVGRILGLKHPRVLGYYERRGLRFAEVFETHGRCFKLYRRADAVRFEKEWFDGGGPERKRWQDPSYRCRMAERRGELAPIVAALLGALDLRRKDPKDAERFILEQARNLWIEQDEDRRKQDRPSRAGRKPSKSPASHHLVWMSLGAEKLTELQAEYDEQEELDTLAEGARRPRKITDLEVLYAVAEDPGGLEHLDDHHRLWDADGERFFLNPATAEQAVDTIVKAIKRLQKRGTEIPPS